MNTGPLTVSECDVLAYLLDRLLANTPPGRRLKVRAIDAVRDDVLHHRALAAEDSFSRKVTPLRSVP